MARVDLNRSQMSLDEDQAVTLVSSGVIALCLTCDPLGHEYHLAGAHTYQELRAMVGHDQVGVAFKDKVRLAEHRPLIVSKHIA